jgi:translation initiation factor IF-3
MADKLKEYTVDEDVDTPEVQVKSQQGLSEPQSLWQLLRSIDRSITHVVQLTKPGEREIAVVQIMERRDMIKAIAKKEEASRKAAYAVKAKKPKQLELNWAIAPNDLQLKLKQMEGFLQQGKKVEVMLAAKRHQRKATPQEADELLKAIRERIESTGARESKPFEGRLLGQALMTIEK